MRNLLALIGLALVVFLGVGYYLGWYKFDSSTGLNGKKHISFEVDTKKLESDIREGGEKLADKVGDATDSLKKSQPDFVGPQAPSTGNSGLFAPPKFSN